MSDVDWSIVKICASHIHDVGLFWKSIFRFGSIRINEISMRKKNEEESNMAAMHDQYTDLGIGYYWFPRQTSVCESEVESHFVCSEGVHLCTTVEIRKFLSIFRYMITFMCFCHEKELAIYRFKFADGKKH